MKVTDADVKRFESYFIKNINGCWIWDRSTRKGYGRIRISGKHYSAHRVSYVIYKGDIPAHGGTHGMCVLHRCDTPKCVNPDHLFLGTMTDNNIDKCKKGRHSSRKLTKHQVYRIREYKKLNISSAVDLGKMFGVDKSTIHKICRGASYKHM